MARFETKVTYEKAGDDGLQTIVKESYIVTAPDVTGAEKRIIDELAPFCTGDIAVKSAKEVDYTEIFTDGKADTFYKVKCAILTMDEVSGKEKSTTMYFLVDASNINEAIANFDKEMAATMQDYRVASVQETKIFDVYLDEKSE